MIEIQIVKVEYYGFVRKYLVISCAEKCYNVWSVDPGQYHPLS